MTELERDIHDGLMELEKAVAEMPTADPKPDLRPLFEKLDTLAARLPRDTDPNFMHYMHKKSYQKARLFLEDRAAENRVGNCRHV